MSLQVEVRKKLRGFSLEVAFDTKGCRQGILGASGCGKSMTLKMIAGIERPDEGRILLGDRTLFDSAAGIDLAPQERKVGYLFQNYALFPHMTVAQNIAAGLPKGETAKVREMLTVLQLEGLERRYPSQLSGGQQQRVALARCLAYEPSVIMLDEPFSALDEYLKEQLQREVKIALENYVGEVLLVSHNRDEVYGFCRRVAILHEGRVVASGETKEVFRDPDHVTAARLSGCKNLSPVEILAPHRILALDWGVELETAEEVTAEIRYVGIRAHHIRLHPRQALPAEDIGNWVTGKTVEMREDLFENNVMFSTGCGNLWCKMAREEYEKQFGTEDGREPEAISLPPDKLLLLRGGNQ